MASGAKYANGNYKAQQKAYNKTKKGKKLRVNANKLNRKLGTYGTLKGATRKQTSLDNEYGGYRYGVDKIKASKKKSKKDLKVKNA